MNTIILILIVFIYLFVSKNYKFCKRVVKRFCMEIRYSFYYSLKLIWLFNKNYMEFIFVILLLYKNNENFIIKFTKWSLIYFLILVLAVMLL